MFFCADMAIFLIGKKFRKKNVTKTMVQPVVGVTSGEVTVLEKNGPTRKKKMVTTWWESPAKSLSWVKKWSQRGGSHQRSHCLGKTWSNPWWESPAKSLFRQKMAPPGRKKWSNRGGSQQRSHCLGKKMVQPMVEVNSEVTVLDPLKRFPYSE